MKLKDWLSYNKALYDGDLVVKVFKKKSYETKDIDLETIVRPDVASKFFGEYEIAKFSVSERPSGNGMTIGVLLWPEESSEEDDAHKTKK